jgi:hypothetical protein
MKHKTFRGISGMAARRKPEDLPENYSQLRDEVLSANNGTLNLLVSRLVYGISDTKKLVGLPSFISFEKIMDILTLLRAALPSEITWPMSITENLKGASKSRTYVAGLGVHAYEIECGPHGGTTQDEALWWETEARTKTVAYGSTPEVALLRACLLLAAQQSFAKQIQSVH